MEIKKWTGLHNTGTPESMEPGQMEAAYDVDIDADFKVRTRLGQTQISAVASHSIWANDEGDFCVVMQGPDMKRMDESGNLTQLKRLSSSAPVSYAELNHVIYFSNGTDTGRIVEGTVREWGIRNPIGQPGAAPTYGGLPPGRYLYAMTFLRLDEKESGSLAPQVIELTDSGGISFTAMEVSTDPHVVSKCLYLSAPNGTELYRIAVVPNADTSYSYMNAGLDLGIPLGNEFAEPAPAGTIVEIYAGVAYVIKDGVAWASDIYDLEQFSKSSRFIPMPDQITMFAAVEDGIFVGNTKDTWFFEGTDVTNFKARRVLNEAAVPGTVTKFDAAEEMAGKELPVPSRTALAWMSSDGVVFAQASGHVRKVTMAKYSIPMGTVGAGLLRAQRGYVSYVVSQRGMSPNPTRYQNNVV